MTPRRQPTRPSPTFECNDSFTFTSNDGTLDSNVATVSITVTAANDAPVAADQAADTAVVTARAITLGATDADGGELTYSVIAGPAHGSLSGTGANVTYTPAPNFSGNDSFTFKANDGTVDSNVATVSITVTAANDAPEAADQAVAHIRVQRQLHVHVERRYVGFERRDGLDHGHGRE